MTCIEQGNYLKSPNSMQMRDLIRKEKISMKELVSIKHEVAATKEFSKDLFSNWVSFLDAKEKTVQTYTRAIKQFMYYMQENGITSPTRQDVVNYRNYLKDTHKPTTVQSYLMAVKQFFKWTELEGLYPNVAINVKGVKLDTGFKKDYLTSKQVKRLLNTVDQTTAKGLRDYAIILLMVTTGLRTVEVERANVEDIRTLGDSTVLYIQGKGHTERTQYVKLAEPVENAIREYLNTREELKTNEPLFTSIANRNSGKRMTTRSISRIAKENMVQANLKSDRLTAHSLRHTTATLNLLNGGTPEETMQLLRHTNLNTTLIYSHALERANNNSEERITNAIFN